jgi:hypothetical protein
MITRYLNKSILRRRTVVVLIWLFFMPVGARQSSANEQIVTNKVSNMNTKEILEHWLQQIERIPLDQFIPIADFAAFNSRARTESIYWCDVFLRQAANPHTKTNLVQHGYLPAGKVNLDLLRHEVQSAGQHFTVFEGVNFLIVRLLAQPSQPWTEKTIDTTTSSVLNLTDAQHSWVFSYPPNLTDGTLVSTAPAVDPSMMHSWFQRADVLLRQGRLYLICYKRYPSTMGFLHDAQWFEDHVRVGTHP